MSLERYAIWLLKAPQAEAYIQRFNDKRLREYGMAYLHWLCNPGTPEPADVFIGASLRAQIRAIMECVQ